MLLRRGKVQPHAAHRSATALLMAAHPDHGTSAHGAFLDHGMSGQGSFMSGHGSWHERPGIVVRAARDRGPSGQGSWHERPWIVARASHGPFTSAQVTSILVSPDEMLFLTKSPDPKLIKYDLRDIGSIEIALTSNAAGAARVGTPPVL